MSGDAALVRRAAHTLKSSAANLGATALSKLCGTLEAQALAGELDAVAAQTDVLHFELDGVMAALSSLRPAAAVATTAAQPKENRA